MRFNAFLNAAGLANYVERAIRRGEQNLLQVLSLQSRLIPHETMHVCRVHVLRKITQFIGVL